MMIDVLLIIGLAIAVLTLAAILGRVYPAALHQSLLGLSAQRPSAGRPLRVF